MKKLPLLARILIAIIMGIVLGFFVPVWCVKAMNTFNALFDQFLHFLIPLIIVGLVTPAIADVGGGAKRLLIITSTIAFVATVGSGLFGLLGAETIFPNIITHEEQALEKTNNVMTAPYFVISIPALMDVMTALVTSFLVGLGITFYKADTLKHCFDEFKNIVTMAIESLIIPLLPYYIFGLFLNISAEGKVAHVLINYAAIIGIILVLTLILLLIQYSIAGAIVKRNPLKLLRTMLPAYATALGTSSSAATIPVTLKQTIANGVSEDIAGFVVPLCATIHLSGSALKIVTCSIAIMLMEGISYDMPLMLGFIMMIAITMVAAPGVPGGAIMAAIGIIDTMLGFTPEQQAMMITLYIAMDSFGTACNVTGDGAIALIIDKIKVQ